MACGQRSSPLFAPDGSFVGHTKRTDLCAPVMDLDVEEHCKADAAAGVWCRPGTPALNM